MAAEIRAQELLDSDLLERTIDFLEAHRSKFDVLTLWHTVKFLEIAIRTNGNAASSRYRTVMFCRRSNFAGWLGDRHGQGRAVSMQRGHVCDRRSLASAVQVPIQDIDTVLHYVHLARPHRGDWRSARFPPTSTSTVASRSLIKLTLTLPRNRNQ